MEISLSPVLPEEKQFLSELITDYQKELLKKEGVGKYKYLDSYWIDKNRFPFFIKDGSKTIGFALINKHTLVAKDSYNISEFYVEKNYRGKGVGKIAAIKIFELFPGKWEVREMENNIKARVFWKKIINIHTKGKYSEVYLDNENWKGFVQTFDSSLK